MLTLEPPVIGWLDAVPVARTITVTHLAEVLDPMNAINDVVTVR